MKWDKMQIQQYFYNKRIKGYMGIIWIILVTFLYIWNYSKEKSLIKGESRNRSTYI